MIGFAIGLVIAIAIKLNPHHERLTYLALHFAYPAACYLLRLLYLLMGPYIFFSVASAIGNVHTQRTAMRLTLRLLGFYVVTTVIAILIGQSLVALVEPGLKISPMQAPIPIPAEFASPAAQIDTLEELLEPMLQTSSFTAIPEGKLTLLIALSIFCGLLPMLLSGKASAFYLYLLRSAKTLSEKPIDLWMYFAPAVIAAITAGTFLRVNNSFAQGMVEYVAVVIVGIGAQFFVVYPAVLYWMGRFSFTAFLSRARPVILASFFARNSNVVLPLMDRTLRERFRVSESISSLTVPLGANFHLDGSALYEAVTILFVAQAFRIDFTLVDHFYLVFFVLVTSVGLPGVPGSSLPLMATCLATFGIPVEGMGLILGVDGILGMFRAALNTSGDILGSLYVANAEGLPLDLPTIGQTDSGAERPRETPPLAQPEPVT
jgi:Na+/H+-dicarboxylate symporter